MYKLKQVSPEELDHYVTKHHPEANFLQRANWGKVHEEIGEKVFYLGLYQDRKMIGSAVATLKHAKRGTYIEIPGGPLIDWESKVAAARAFLEQLKQLAKENRCVFVRLRPNIDDTPAHRALVKLLGLKPAPMYLHAEHTVMLDLTKDLDQLMQEMRRQTRYEVRRSAKLGIKVTVEHSKKALDDFYKLQLQTAQRQNFIPSSHAIAEAQLKIYGDQAQIYTASLDGQILAQALVLFEQPEAIYHEAASAPAGRKYPGAYALQWQIIQDAKAKSIPRYNLFGVAPPNQPQHRFAGVTTFKNGFGGEKIAYLPAQDLVISPARYRVVHAIETIRKKRRHL